MSAEVVDDGSGHPVRAGLDLVRQGLDLLLGASTWSLSDAQLRGALVGLTAQAGRVEAARAVLVRECVSRETPDARGQRGARTANLLQGTCRVGRVRASADVANAKVTCPQSGDLRGLGAALGAGEVSREHLDVARRCLTRLPERLVRERREEVDQQLTAHARTWDPGTSDLLAQHLLAVVDPDRSDRYDQAALDRRHLGLSTDSTGMVLLRGQLDQVAGLELLATLDHLVAADRATRGTGASGAFGACFAAGAAGADGAADAAVSGADVRTRGQRRADALGRMVAIAAEQLGLPPSDSGTAVPAPPTDPAADPPTGPAAVVGPDEVVPSAVRAGHRAVRRAVPRVVVLTTPEQLAGATGAGAAVTSDGSLLDRGTLIRLTCDAVIDRVVLARDGRVLAMDTLGRLATPAQQQALAARDGGCTWPGCTAPPSTCEAHHVIWWCRGGPTAMDNLALLCQRHHTQVHAEPDDGWQMVMYDGVPWFRPPDRVDPSRTLRRDPIHQAVRAARHTGTSWRAAAPSSDTDPDPP